MLWLLTGLFLIGEKGHGFDRERRYQTNKEINKEIDNGEIILWILKAQKPSKNRQKTVEKPSKNRRKTIKKPSKKPIKDNEPSGTTKSTNNRLSPTPKNRQKNRQKTVKDNNGIMPVSGPRNFLDDDIKWKQSIL